MKTPRKEAYGYTALFSLALIALDLVCEKDLFPSRLLVPGTFIFMIAAIEFDHFLHEFFSKKGK